MDILSLLQEPGPKKFKLFKIELIYKAKKFEVPPFTVLIRFLLAFGPSRAVSTKTTEPVV